MGKQRRPVTSIAGAAVILLVGEIKVGNHSPSTRIQTQSAPVHFSVISWQLFKFYRSANQHKVEEAEHPTAPLHCPLEKKETSPGCSREVTSAAAHPEEDERRRRGKLKIESLPYNRRVALADGDVVGGPLHIHTPDGESCGDKTQQS